jgi:hypothetical protein
MTRNCISKDVFSQVVTMTRSQRNKLVAANADLILGGDFAIEECAVHLSSAIFLLLAGEPGDHSPLSAASPAR